MSSSVQRIPNVVGRAYGPNFSSGVSAFGVYPLMKDESGRLCVFMAGRTIEVQSNGVVVKNHEMMFRLTFD